MSFAKCAFIFLFIFSKKFIVAERRAAYTTYYNTEDNSISNPEQNYVNEAEGHYHYQEQDNSSYYKGEEYKNYTYPPIEADMSNNSSSSGANSTENGAGESTGTGGSPAAAAMSPETSGSQNGMAPEAENKQAASPPAGTNPLDFLNLLGTDFQPGRLVNIFFGLMIMIFMMVIQGYAMWVFGIAFLPGTRSLNSNWTLNLDVLEKGLSIFEDAFDRWNQVSYER